MRWRHYWSWQKILLSAGMIVWLYVLTFSLQRSAGYIDISNQPELLDRLEKKASVTVNDGGNTTVYSRESPIIIITGPPRSGVNLLRIILDAHPEIRCAPGSGFPMSVVSYRAFIRNSPVESERLSAAGVTNEIIDLAFSEFLLQIFARQGKPSTFLCIAEHTSAENYGYLELFFPNAKFVHIIRDGRAVADSFTRRKIDLRIEGFATENYAKNLVVWNKMEKDMLKQCVHAGDEKCMAIYYELMVHEPELWLRKLCKFLNVSWDERLLQHHRFVADKSIQITSFTENREGLARPMNNSYASAWVKHVPKEMRDSAFNKAPVLKLLGYDRSKIRRNSVDYSELARSYSDIQKAWKMTLE